MTGLYVHIPFCVQKCKYCDFNSFVGLEEIYEDYFSCLEKEVKKTEDDGELFDTVYMGGGTPTAVPCEYLSKFICSLKNITDDCEITVECNPGTVSLDYLKEIKNAGANRLSIGLQSTNDDELKMLGRIHTFRDFEESLLFARQAGFDNISLDIMFGLPNQTLASFEKTVNKAAELGCEHISCYCLKIEEGTPFSKMKLILPDDDLCADMYELCTNILAKHGYDRYEISNFAKDGKTSRHNTKYWTMEEYTGIGAGAHSLFRGRRFSRISNVKEYIERTIKGEDNIENSEIISTKEKMSEFMFLGLRMTKGVSEKDFLRSFGISLEEVFGKQVEKYLKMGVMEISGDRIFIKPEFLYVSNNILSEFV